MAAMRVVFMGTPDFAVASLKALLEREVDVVGVITAPDRPAGRGQQLRPSAVKQFALEHDLHVLQPTNLKNETFLEELQALRAELFVVVAFRMLPEVVWGMPAKGTINLHGSLLPQYRGAAPINRAIMNGEQETGVTTFFIRAAIDTGAIIDKATTPIGPDETAGEVHDRLMNIGAQLLADTVIKISEGAVTAIPQEDLIDGSLKEAPKIFKDDCKIDWQQPALSVHNHIRGLSPYPAAWSTLQIPEQDAKSVKVFKTSVEEATLAPGAIRTDGKQQLLVGTAEGAIRIHELQLAGKKRMRTEDLLRGFNIEETYSFI